MKITATGIPYEYCPVCHQMMVPKAFGGKSHINSHKVTEANRLFNTGLTIQRVNNQLSSMGIDLFANIPPKMRDVTRDTKIIWKGETFHVSEFDYYDNIRLISDETQRVMSIKLWDRRFLNSAEFENA